MRSCTGYLQSVNTQSVIAHAWPSEIVVRRNHKLCSGPFHALHTIEGKTHKYNYQSVRSFLTVRSPRSATAEGMQGSETKGFSRKMQPSRDYSIPRNIVGPTPSRAFSDASLDAMEDCAFGPIYRVLLNPGRELETINRGHSEEKGELSVPQVGYDLKRKLHRHTLLPLCYIN